MNLIPAIDLIDGEVVRLFKGDYTKKTVYDINPIELTEQWDEIGIKRIHIVDLQGAKTGNQKNLETNLYTKDIPNPDILIRTENTNRLSNFLF